MLLVALLTFSGTAVRAGDEVFVKQSGGAIEIETSAHVPFDPGEVWPVVLDFGGLARFMPNVDTSLVVARTPNTVTVHQVGTTTFLVSRTVRFDLRFQRLNDVDVGFTRVAGDFDSFRGIWSVRGEEGGSRVSYHAYIHDDFGVPGFIVRHVVRRDAARMMPAIEREVRRRHG